MKKILFLVSLLVISGFVGFGCGQTNSSTTTTVSSSTTTSLANPYRLQGKLASLSVAGIRVAAVLEVTHIVAISSSGQAYLASLEADGAFTIDVNTGYPYALGFYNKTGSTITMLGYLQQSEVSWESLPLMNPVGTSTNLGTIEINATSEVASPSIDLSSLISSMHMVDLATAQYFGAINSPMAAFTNVDVDGNGVFDFQEGKAFIFQSYINVGGGTGQMAQMLNGQYNESYRPSPTGYNLLVNGRGDGQTAGTSVVFHFPSEVSGVLTYSSSVEMLGTDIWYSSTSMNSTPIFAPSGTYTLEVGSQTYTFNNYKASAIMGIGASEGIIFPVFNLVTDEAGYITTVNFKWKKIVGATSEAATAGEVAATVEYNWVTPSAFVHTSPFISFFGATGLISGIINYNRDGNTIDVSPYRIKLSDVDHIQASYNLTSRVVCKFDLN